MKLGSLFDGSGGFPLAGTLCGIEPVWASEIEPYPIAVTRSRFPKMKHFGDISKINGAEVEPVDIITFGSPCQDLSVAGKRAGLKHEANGDEETTRSGLFMEAVRIIKEMREATNGEYPSFALWENVPGAFSSNKGEDFRIVLEELIKIVEPTAVMPEVPKGGWAYADSYCGAGWSIAYRVFDAQYWGVPQRRRRIHLVLDLRGERAQEVLFEREGVRGYLAEGRTPWQAAPTDAEGSVGADDREGANVGTLTPWDSQGNQVHDGTGNNVYPCLRGCGGAGYQAGYVLAASADDREGNDVIAFAQNQRDEVRDLGDKAGALQAEPGMKQQTFLAQPVVAGGFCPEQSAKTRGIGWEEEMAPTLRAGVVPGVVSAVTFEPGIAAREGGHIYEGVCGTLRANAGDNQMAVAYSFDSLSSNSMKSANPHSGCREVEVAKCLDTTNPNPGKNQGGIAIVQAVKTWDARGNGDGETVSTLTGDHENRITDYTSVVVEPAPNVIDVEMEVAVRKYEVDTDKLSALLRDHKGNRTNREIAEALNQPITMVEHWFRSDSYFAIPDADIWFDLKKLLGIETTEFDQCITEYEFKGGNYDMRNRIYAGDVAPTLTVGCGNHLHLVSEPVYCLQGNGIDRADTAGCNGRGWNDETCYTLNTIDRPAVVYTASKASFFTSADKDLASTLVATDYKDPQLVAYRQGGFADYVENEIGTLKASGGDLGGGSENLICMKEARYIVRRLTPTECARLQGFVDRWGDIEEKTDFTDEEYAFWLDVRNTHAAINGRVVKEYTKAQMLTWYNKLHTDSAEYKMWGNGIALPPALYCMQGIVEASA